MKILVKNKYKKEITTEVINKILTGLRLSTNYTLEYVNGNGRDIIIKHNNKNIFVIVSRVKADSRNAFLAQYVPTVLSEYIKDPAKEKEIYIFLLDTSDKAKTPFIIDTYRICKTLGISIINERDLRISKIQPYNTFQD